MDEFKQLLETGFEISVRDLAEIKERFELAGEDQPESLFGRVVIKTNKHIPRGRAIVMAHPTQAQREGREPYPREDQVVVVKLDNNESCAEWSHMICEECWHEWRGTMFPIQHADSTIKTCCYCQTRQRNCVKTFDDPSLVPCCGKHRR